MVPSAGCRQCICCASASSKVWQWSAKVRAKRGSLLLLSQQHGHLCADRHNALLSV